MADPGLNFENFFQSNTIYGDMVCIVAHTVVQRLSWRLGHQLVGELACYVNANRF